MEDLEVGYASAYPAYPVAPPMVRARNAWKPNCLLCIRSVFQSHLWQAAPAATRRQRPTALDMLLRRWIDRQSSWWICLWLKLFRLRADRYCTRLQSSSGAPLRRSRWALARACITRASSCRLPLYICVALQARHAPLGASHCPIERNLIRSAQLYLSTLLGGAPRAREQRWAPGPQSGRLTALRQRQPLLGRSPTSERCSTSSPTNINSTQRCL